MLTREVCISNTRNTPVLDFQVFPSLCFAGKRGSSESEWTCHFDELSQCGLTTATAAYRTPAMVHPGLKWHNHLKNYLLLNSSQFSPPPFSGAKPRRDEHLQSKSTYSDSSLISLLCTRLTLTLSSISSCETTNSRDLGTALVLGCSHRSVIPAVAIRALSRWSKVMDQAPFCGLQARLWTLQ